MLLVRHSVFQVLSVPFSVYTSVLDPSSSVPYTSILIAKNGNGFKFLLSIAFALPSDVNYRGCSGSGEPAMPGWGSSALWQGAGRAPARYSRRPGCHCFSPVVPQPCGAKTTQKYDFFPCTVPVKLLPNIWSGMQKRCISFVNTRYMKPYSSVSFPL